MVELSLNGHITTLNYIAVVDYDVTTSFLTAFLAMICTARCAIHSGLIITISILTLAKEAILGAGMLKVVCGITAFRRGLATDTANYRHIVGARDPQSSTAILLLMNLLMLLHHNCCRLNTRAT